MMIQRKERHRYVIEVCHTQRIQGNVQEEQYVERKNVYPPKSQTPLSLLHYQRKRLCNK